MSNHLQVGQRVTAEGVPGTVVSVSRFDEVYPDVVHLQALAARPRKVPADPDSFVVAVQLDGEERPRNFPDFKVKGGD